MKISKNSGVATLPTVMVIGLMSLAVVVSITSVAFNELLISSGSVQSSNALFFAESGARDALVRIARNKNYTCSTADCYSIDFATNSCVTNTDCAKVSVSAGVGTTGDPKIIISKGLMRSSIRRVQVSVILDGGTAVAADQNGEITGMTWVELTN